MFSRRLVLGLVEEPKAKAMKAARAYILKMSLIIKFVDKGQDISTGSIQSSELPGDIETVQLRVLHLNMNTLSNHSRYDFCLNDSTSISGSMIFKTNIYKEVVPGDIHLDLPMVTVYFQKVGRQSIFAEASNEMKNLGKIDMKLT